MGTQHAPVDVVVVGAGPGGAITSMILAERGLRVVCLDQGGWTPHEERPHYDEDWEYRRAMGDWSLQPNVRRRPQDYPIDTADEKPLM